METKKGKEYLTKQDFQQHSVWIEHDEDDLTYPVYGADDFPENMTLNDLRIRTRFITATGLELNGYIIGLKDIYCVAIFLDNEVVYLNKNLNKDCLAAIEKINKMTRQNLSIIDFSPSC